MLRLCPASQRVRPEGGSKPCPDPARDVALVLGKAEGSGSTASVSAVTAERGHAQKATRTTAGSGGIPAPVMMCWPKNSSTGHDGGTCKVQEPDDKSCGVRYTQAPPRMSRRGNSSLKPSGWVRRRQAGNEEKKNLRRVSSWVRPCKPCGLCRREHEYVGWKKTLWRESPHEEGRMSLWRCSPHE